MMKKIFGFFRRDIELKNIYNFKPDKGQIKEMKLFQKDKIIITTYENYLLIYDIINLELLLENKLYSKPKMLGIYEHNKFFIQEKEISFFEFIGSSSSEIKNKYF